ncbi:Mbov_0392 family ICE element protein [Mycoplasmopsis bovis]|uniref:Mbov_0392 family ICE element protein n=1 Tax=Mycoplasmopsis bovis TaxID=28903 RepID=UPI003C2AC6D4
MKNYFEYKDIEKLLTRRQEENNEYLKVLNEKASSFKNEQEKAQYVELVKSIFINLEKIASYPIAATKFAFNTCKVIESQAFTIPELQKLLELTKIALLFDNSVFMKNFNNFGCGADYLNFLIDLHDIEPVFALKEMLNEQDEYDWIDWELYSLYKKRNKELPWLNDLTNDDDLVYIGDSNNSYDWHIVDERDLIFDYLNSHMDQEHIVSWIMAKELDEQHFKKTN